MGSKLGLILSLFFAVFVFIFAADLIVLQANYSNLESIANTVSLMISEKGGASTLEIMAYIGGFNGVSIKYDTPVFKVGEFKEFSIQKDHQSILFFKDSITLTVKRTVLVGQFERTY